MLYYNLKTDHHLGLVLHDQLSNGQFEMCSSSLLTNYGLIFKLQSTDCLDENRRKRQCDICM